MQLKHWLKSMKKILKISERLLAVASQARREGFASMTRICRHEARKVFQLDYNCQRPLTKKLIRQKVECRRSDLSQRPELKF